MRLDWDKVEIDHLPDQLQEIAGEVGLDVVKYLIESWGGTVMYFPTLTRLMTHYENEQILREYTGDNELELTRKFNVSRNRIRRAIRAREQRSSRSRPAN